MSPSSPPPGLADRKPPTSGQGVRASRGREEIAQLTARLRSEHNEYESASQSWSPEAEKKKRELRKARADTLVEIGAALARLGEVKRLQEIERLPFEQKLARLEAFLAEAPVARPEQEATQERARTDHHRREQGACVQGPLSDGGQSAEGRPSGEVTRGEDGGGDERLVALAPLAIHEGEGEDHGRGGG